MTDRDRLPASMTNTNDQLPVAYDALAVKKKKKKPVKPVTTPSFQKLWERWASGTQGKKEIMRRIGKVDAKKLPEAEQQALKVLMAVAYNNRWIEQ